jgi:adenylate kinase
LRAVILGIAGIAKREYIDRVRTIACDKNVFPGGAASPRADNFLLVRDVDKELENRKGGYAQYGAYLGRTNQDEQQKFWAEVCNEVIGEINKRNPTHAFLLVHAVYFRNKMYRSMINLNLLREFKPTVIVTLIEDSYDVTKRIEDKERTEGTGSRCTFAEALSWRTVETMFGDLLSRNISDRNIEHFVVARKHAPEMVYRLLFERYFLRVYAAFPISATRHQNKAVSEINAFRKRLCDEFTVFDPVTIDEYPVTRTTPPKVKRWPMENIQLTVDGIRKMRVGDFTKLKADILRIIEARDFTLVNQSDCVVAFRPYYGGREDPSKGVDREMLEAHRAGKPVFVVHDDEKDGELTAERKMFEPIADATAIKPNLEELLDQIKKMAAEKKRKWTEDGKSSTFE